MEPNVISLDKITKSYDTQKVLDEVVLDIARGDFIAVMGESGAGKSTLVKILALLEQPDSGEYKLFGDTVSGIPINKASRCRRRSMNIIFQTYNLFEELSVYENLSVYLKLCNEVSRNMDASIKAVANALKMQDNLYKKVSVLSQGEKQRVAIARSLLTDKKLILADEPTASLDKDNRDTIIQILSEANSRGDTVVVVTHDYEYLKFATRKYYLASGKMSEI